MKYLLLFTFFQTISFSQNTNDVFTYLDVFDLQYVSSPQISPDGSEIIYRRMTFDILKDKAVGNLWTVNVNGSNHQKLTSRESEEYGATWSPDGDRLAFISSTEEGSEIYIYWKNSSKYAKISQLEGNPSNLSWSSNGTNLAFTMKVKTLAPVLVKMPKKPKGAKWAKTARITDRLYHESDGKGYIEPGFTHVFLISSEGSGVSKLTSGNFNHRGPLSWSKDNSKIYFTSNRHESWEYEFRNSEIYSVDIIDQKIRSLTDRNGPDSNPKVSPNGKHIAYLGYQDKVQAYQNTQLSIMDTNGDNTSLISFNVDSSINDYHWDSNSKGIYYSYDKLGDTKIAYLNLDGSFRDLAENLGGNSIGRPYGGGSFSVSNNGVIAYTNTSYKHPSELTVVNGKKSTQITNLNSHLLENRNLGFVEEIWYKSSFDNRDIHGWVVYPPNYDSSKSYPFLVENHESWYMNIYLKSFLV
jgi:Tol biopolymer transport system component